MNEVQTHFVGGDSISVALRGAHICMATVFHILNSDYEVLTVTLESLRPGEGQSLSSARGPSVRVRLRVYW